MFHFIFAVCQIITSIQSVTFTQSLTRHQHLSPARFQRDRVIKQLSNEGHGMNIKSWYFASNFPGPRTLKKNDVRENHYLVKMTNGVSAKIMIYSRGYCFWNEI